MKAEKPFGDPSIDAGGVRVTCTVSGTSGLPFLENQEHEEILT